MYKEEPHNLDQQGKLESLEQALCEGINSGDATEMTREDWGSIMARAKDR
jgi:hypothetical protein